MKMEPVKPLGEWTWDDVKPILKLVAWGIGAIMAAFGGTAGVREVADQELVATEVRAGATQEAARMAVFEARESHREDIEAALVARAKCDAALEGFARHRDDDRDWAHVLEECHTEGEIE